VKKVISLFINILALVLMLAIIFFAIGMFELNWFPELSFLPRWIITIISVIIGFYLIEEMQRAGSNKIRQQQDCIITNTKETIITTAVVQTDTSTYSPHPETIIQETEAEKAQRLLNNYWRKRKDKEEIGRDYERFIGWTFECAGYKVQYNGIEKKLEDGGIDLICRNGKTIDIVQCKNWAKEKIVHEKHINQLYGAFQSYKIENNINDSCKAKAVFITSAEASETARRVANNLCVELIEGKLMDTSYPCIKCNISSTGEKIYHLPFDAQYDRTKITKKEECYVKTIEEAEKLGFRKAN